MEMTDERTIIVAIPVPEFIFTAIHSQDLPVAQAGYYSRQYWTNNRPEMSKLPPVIQKEISDIKQLYYVREADGFTDASPQVLTTRDDTLYAFNRLAFMIGACAVHVHGMPIQIWVTDVFNGKNNKESSDWDDYLWAGYNKFLLLAEVPLKRCLVFDKNVSLIQAAEDISQLTKSEVMIPFLSQHEVLEYYVKIGSPEISNGERAWVNLKNPNSITWGSSHGHIQPECRECVMKLVQQQMANEFANWCEGNTSAF